MTTHLLLLGSVLWVQEDVIAGVNLFVRHAQWLILIAIVTSLHLLMMLPLRYELGLDNIHKVCPLVRNYKLLHACGVVQSKVVQRP